jgi:hypothetical protein
MAKISRVVVWFCCLSLWLPALLAGQATNARITGDVQDDAGIFLTGVAVTAINVVNRAETKVLSDDNGAFRFLALAPGFYQVSFDLEGYKSFVASGIQLSADQSATLHAKLETLLGPEGKPLRPQAERPKPQAARPAEGIGKKWQLELAVGALFGEPDDLNGSVVHVRWLCKEQALHYLYTPDFWSLNLDGVSTGTLAPLGGGQPLTARVRFSLNKTLSLALGIGYFDHRRVSTYARTFDISHGPIGSIGTQEKFSVRNEVPDFRLGAKGLFPHVGVQGSHFVGRRVRLAAFVHAGWTFAECSYSSTRRFLDGWTGQDRLYEVAMNGKGNGFTLEGGAKIEVAVWRGLGIFFEGLYQSCRVKNVTGDRTASETVNDAGAPNAGSRTTVISEGPWRQVGTGITYPYIHSPGDETSFVPFTLNLGGLGLRAGVFFRF